jgi:cobalt-zinc-cadmium efflux system protein
MDAAAHTLAPPHAHGHNHHHESLRGTPEGRIKLALALTLACLGASLLGGFLAHSLALLSDAGHMLSDAGSLALALFAQRVATRPRTLARTYGSRRAETLAAFVNAILLGVTAVWVIVEAVARWEAPPPVDGGLLLGFATIGLLGNLAAAWALGGGGAAHNANTRAALAHVIYDALGSVAAMAAGVFVLVFGWNRADPLISLGLALLILWSAWTLVRQAADVLMESTPVGLDLDALERTIRETPGVADLHDLHAWTISDGFDLMTVHVLLDGGRHGTDVAREVSDRVRERHQITHVTVQPEPPSLRYSVHPLASLKRRRTD